MTDNGRAARSGPATAREPAAEPSDDDLMAAAREGRRDAFERLVRRHLGPLSRYCAKFVGDRARGEDLAQEVLVSVWQHCHKYRGDGRFTVYLFTLARNRCRNHHRDGQRQQLRAAEAADSPAHEERDPTALAAMIEAETHARVHAGIAELPEKLREAVLLRFDQGLDYADIARIIGRPEATARTRVFHGLKKLREHLKGAVDA